MEVHWVTLTRIRPLGICGFLLLAACVGNASSQDATGDAEEGGQGGNPQGGGAGGDSEAERIAKASVVRRLNRSEYNNTVRDLLGTTLRPATGFPEDGRSFGFDNQGEVLSISPEQAELYLRAAEDVVADFFSKQSPQRSALIDCDLADKACVDKVMKGFARRAWRRPATTEELAPVRKLVDLAEQQGDPRIEGIKLAFAAVLSSPRFLFRLEFDPANAKGGKPRPLDAYELATRLSYFLWGSTPDDELAAAADDGTLLNADVRRKQVARMVAHEKARAVVTSFAAQWLSVARLEQHEVEKAIFPTYDDELRAAMRTETESLFGEVLFKKLPLETLLTADFTFVNAKLAGHYGLAPPAGGAFTKVSLSGNKQRGGILTQAGPLTATSLPHRTSPSSRGKWVLDQLLCEPPPPPPATVPGLDDGEKPANAVTVRQRLEEHRKNPQCSGCHALVDPMGFPLENYNGIGAWRDKESAVPIDATAELLDGTKLDSSRSLAQAIAADPRFIPCVAKQLYVFALGYKVMEDSLDAQLVEAIGAKLKKTQGTMPDLIDAIVDSQTFTSRRAFSGDAQ